MNTYVPFYTNKKNENVSKTNVAVKVVRFSVKNPRWDHNVFTIASHSRGQIRRKSRIDGGTTQNKRHPYVVAIRLYVNEYWILKVVTQYR